MLKLGMAKTIQSDEYQIHYEFTTQMDLTEHTIFDLDLIFKADIIWIWI